MHLLSVARRSTDDPMSAAICDVQRSIQSILLDLDVAGAVPVVCWRLQNVLQDLQSLIPPRPGHTAAMRAGLKQRQPKSSAAILEHHRALQAAWRARNRDKLAAAQRARNRQARVLARQMAPVAVVLDSQYQRVSALLCPPEIDVDTWAASRPTMSDDVKDAAAMSTYISNHLPVHVCAICGVYRGLADLHRVQATQLPMHLLRADGPGINGRAPAALTLCCIDGIKYCLAHEGVSATANSPCTFVMSPAPLSVQSAVFACSLAHVSLAVCSQHCLPALLRSKVPRFSLVAFDAGRVPHCQTCCLCRL